MRTEGGLRLGRGDLKVAQVTTFIHFIRMEHMKSHIWSVQQHTNTTPIQHT